LMDDPVRREAIARRGRQTFVDRFDDVAVAPSFGLALSSVTGGGARRERRLPPLTVMARLRQPFVSDALRTAKPRSILEVGAGQGSMGVRLARRARYVGVEPDMSSAAVAAARLARVEGADFRMGGIDRVGADETFDVICAFEVLEHIEDDVGAMRDWLSHLGADGHVLFSVPAHRRRFGAADEAVGHFRRYDAVDVERLVGSVGLEVISRRAYGALGGHVLETVRNVVISRRGGNVSRDAALCEKTAASGRLFQPDGVIGGAVTALVAAPMRAAQRPFAVGQFGVGWVVLARRKRGTV